MCKTLAFSPCPNDTFIFDAMVHHKIETEPYCYEVSYLDVQQLNIAAKNNQFDITKLSYFAASQLLDQYQILTSGSALGFGCGPLLISLKNYSTDDLKNIKIAIPGKNTTANFLLQYVFPEAVDTVEMLFSDIEDAVIEGKVDAGLIIHENRFTYFNKGLQKIADLGEIWEQKTGFPIPLGCIAVKRNIPDEEKRAINHHIKESIRFAFQHPESSKSYVKCHSQELDDDVIKAHINLYVNQYSEDLGPVGKNTIYHMFEKTGLPIEKLREDWIFVS